jgi:hypothetical protein
MNSNCFLHMVELFCFLENTLNYLNKLYFISRIHRISLYQATEPPFKSPLPLHYKDEES